MSVLSLNSGDGVLHGSYQNRLSPSAFMALVAIQAGLIALWIAAGNILYLPMVLLAGWVLFFSLSSLIFWLPIVILGHAALFAQRTEGVSLSEYAFAAFFYLVLLLWLLDRVVVKRERLATVPGDNALALFMVLGVISVLPLLVAEGKPFQWLRELLVFFCLLFYFPLRQGIRSERVRRLVYLSFFVLALGIAAKNIYQYRSGVAIATYIWELLGGRQSANEPLFMSVVLAGVAFWMTAEKPLDRLQSFLVVSFFSLSLLLTFSRGYWLGTFLGIAVMFLLGDRRERKRVLTLGAIVGFAGAALMMVLFYDVFMALFDTIFRRLFSTATAVTDKSFANRIVESATVWELIKKNPILGSGLGTEFSVYHLLRETTQHTFYVHNAYLYLWFKLGIIGLITFLVAFLSKAWLGIRISLRDRTNTLRPQVLCSTAILVAMVQVSITSPQFYARDSVLIIAICWATIAAAWRPAGQGPSL